MFVVLSQPRYQKIQLNGNCHHPFDLPAYFSVIKLWQDYFIFNFLRTRRSSNLWNIIAIVSKRVTDSTRNELLRHDSIGEGDLSTKHVLTAPIAKIPRHKGYDSMDALASRSYSNLLGWLQACKKGHTRRYCTGSRNFRYSTKSDKCAK